MSLQPFDPWPIFQFLNLPYTGNQPLTRTPPTHRTTQTHNKCTQIFMPRVGFEPMTPVFQRAKTFHALDREVTAIGQ
jgi:hypothetical protein